jgi:CRISPR system Cascade subunit CasB
MTLVETSADSVDRPKDTYWALSRHIAKAKPGDRAALSRLQPQSLQPHQLAALSRALLAAGLSPDSWHADTWPRWALITQGIALAGHDGQDRLGRQLAHAGVSESRVTKLLTSRGDAFVQLLPRIVRLLASKGVSPNWHELGGLILSEAKSDPVSVQRSEQLRLGIAGPFFTQLAKEA